MYSPLITAKRFSKAKAEFLKEGIEIKRLPRDQSIETAAKLQKLRFDNNGNPYPGDRTARPLDQKELAFTISERAICKIDFEYYATRYHTIGLDTGVTGEEQTTGPARFLESQVKLLKVIGKREEEVYAEHAKYGMTEGIRVIGHKIRQVVFTTTAREITLHRMLFWPGTRAFAAALNTDGLGELYKRDKLAIDNLPFWLQPSEVYPDVKDSEIGFPSPIGSRLLYQAENQKAGIAVGTQQDVSALTEVPLWQFPEYNIEFSLLPAIPKARSTFHFQEGTSAGKGGYWQTISEACRHKKKGFENWSYIFIPWWVNRAKWRALPPRNWSPDKITLEHAALIERTSPEWNDGVVYRPSIEQLAWWEFERAKYAANGDTASFYQSYGATPEQTFVSRGRGALPVELLEELEFDVRQPRPYSVDVYV